MHKGRIPVFQCVPNFSEGRRPEVVAALADAVANTPGARLIDSSADADHNRCVLTFLGDAGSTRAAALAAALVAVARIDLRTHAGVHPRTGAIDVLPVVPLRGAGREEAAALAHAIGSDLAAELALPVYFYAWAARPGRPSALPELRKAVARNREPGAGRHQLLAPTPYTLNPTPHILPPDLGPDAPHPTAGIAIVGARGPLVAYNITLNTPDAEIACAIAHRIRQERGRRPELEGVRALGLFLASQGRAQVSMNLTRPERTPLPAVFAFVREAAAQLEADVAESEVIGVLPTASLGGQSPQSILWHAYRPAQILETWLP
jgi:glutamate formiminotransferase